MVENSQTNIWISEVQQGDTLALSKLLASYHPRLRARAEARMDPAIKARNGPDDILQDVYIRVFRQVGNFEVRDPNSFLNWIYTILDHVLVDAHRSAHRKVRDVARESPPVVAVDGSSSYWNLFDQIHAVSASPSRVIRREEALGALLACMIQLTEDQQHVIRLRFMEGQSVAEVAKQLDKSEGAVVALTRRALEALRISMQQMGEFTHGL